MGELQFHPLCAMFPRMGEAEFAALRDDIKSNGLLTPITLYEGMILDGGNRYRACLDAGVEPRFDNFDGSDVVTFVLSSNFHRRHLSPGQQATIVAAAQDWSRAQTRGGDRKSDQTASLPFDSTADRQTLSGASEKTQRTADLVARKDPDLAKKVIAGEISLPKAYEQVKTPRQEPEPPADAASVMFAEDCPLSALVSKARALDAIQKIHPADPNALRCLDGIQTALNSRRSTIENILRNKNGH